MAAVNSTMLALGTKAPDFKLPSATGGTISLKDFSTSKGLLVMFICNHCPFVKHVREGLVRLVKEYQDKGVAVVGINANDSQTYPDDSPEQMAVEAKQHGYTFPYLYDEAQQVARAYQAACTPDFFLFDADRKLVYRGQLDDSRPGSSKPVTGRDLRAAIDAVLTGKPVAGNQKASVGCSIKWKRPQA